jgi:hypothetical protein
MLEDEIVFKLGNNGCKSKREIKPICKDLISENLLDSREDLLEKSLQGYELANEYPKRSEEAITNRISAKFNRLLANEIKDFRQYPEIRDVKIIKRRGLFGGRSFSPECNCGENLTKIEAEVTIKVGKRKEQKENVGLFYFCYYCGFSGKVKKGL